eukprot:4355-Chlamydomonas_euryale.AAC.1
MRCHTLCVVQGSWCHTCFSESKGEKIVLEGSSHRKSDLVKKKHEVDEEEPWVACDHCQGWVHQICGMFNKGRNNHGQHFLCPDCLVRSVETGERQRMTVRPQAMLEARDLPVSNLSRYLEHHLAAALMQERGARAAQQ